jgi:hypothetical protein
MAIIGVASNKLFIMMSFHNYLHRSTRCSLKLQRMKGRQLPSRGRVQFYCRHNLNTNDVLKVRSWESDYDLPIWGVRFLD